MCAIVDANVAHEVFGASQQPAGKEFFDWVNKGIGRLIVGGDLLNELSNSCPGFRDWARGAQLAGRLRNINESNVGERAEEIKNKSMCRSNDPHILALAQVSGARLLYSNDLDLQSDFKNKKLIDNPRGSLYSTRISKDFSKAHKKLLRRTDLCQSGK